VVFFTILISIASTIVRVPIRIVCTFTGFTTVFCRARILFAKFVVEFILRISTALTIPKVKRRIVDTAIATGEIVDYARYASWEVFLVTNGTFMSITGLWLAGLTTASLHPLIHVAIIVVVVYVLSILVSCTITILTAEGRVVDTIV